MDPTESKPAGWYPSSRTPGMERYWNGDFWTGKYRPAEELQGQFGIAPNESDPEAPDNEPQEQPAADQASDVWSTLDNSAHSNEPIFAPGVRTEYSVAQPPPPGAQATYGYGQYPAQLQVNPHQGFGIASLVVAFFVPLIGAIMGHVAYSKANKSQSPKGLAIAAIAVGWSFFALQLLFWLPFFIAFFGGFSSSSDYSDSGYSTDNDYSYSQTEEGVIPDYSLSQLVKTDLQNKYPDYDTWYSFCDEGLPTEAGATVQCEVVLYPFSDTNESEENSASVKYISGDEFSPELEITLAKEPTPLESFQRQ